MRQKDLGGGGGEGRGEGRDGGVLYTQHSTAATFILQYLLFCLPASFFFFFFFLFSPVFLPQNKKRSRCLNDGICINGSDSPIGV